jgi:uncharacterized protein YjiS (DUF1127 family)
MAFITDTRGTANTLGQRLSGLLATIVTAYTQRKIYRTTINELDMLTDRELGDLGFGRSMIKQIAFDSAYGK